MSALAGEALLAPDQGAVYLFLRQVSEGQAPVGREWFRFGKMWRDLLDRLDKLLEALEKSLAPAAAQLDLFDGALLIKDAVG